MRKIVYDLCSILPDKLYINLQYTYLTKRKLNLKNPTRFNEKLQWMKLYDRNPMYTQLVDKYEVRQFITTTIGEKYLIPLLGVWESAEQIDFKNLPNQFVLKCNHDSKSVIICKEKELLNYNKTVKHFEKKLKNNSFNYGREWPYKNVKPLVIAEKFMVDETGEDLKDYKVMCFGGKPKLIQVHKNRFNDRQNYTRDFYDSNWNKLNISQAGDKSSKILMDKPIFLEEMLLLSQKLASGLPQARIDWYYTENQLYFGEITFFDASGYYEFDPDEYNEILGSWIPLP